MSGGDWSRHAAWVHARRATLVVVPCAVALLFLAPNWFGYLAAGVLLALLALVYVLWAAVEILIVLTAREGAELVARQIEDLDDGADL